MTGPRRRRILTPQVTTSILETFTRPTRQLNLKTTLLSLRGVIALLMFCFLSFNPNLERDSLFAPMLLVGLYVASNVALIWLPKAVFDNPLIQSGLLLFDVCLISGVIYACQGFDSDLYLIYFVVLLMSGMQMRIWQSLLTGFVASIIYVMLWQRANPDGDLWDANVLLRLPFFYIVALSAAFFAQQSRDREEQAKEVASTEEKIKMETIFSQMKDGAVLINERSEIVLSNESARNYLNMTARAHEPLPDLLAAMKVEPPFPALLSSPAPAVAFEMVREQPKTLILAGTATRMHFESAGHTPAWDGRLFIFRDVTLERDEARIKHSFLSLISHKLRTPITVISGFVQILIKNDSGRTPEEVRRKSYQSIRSQAQKLSGLIEQLIDFNSLKALEPQPLERQPFLLADAARDAVAELNEWLSARGGRIENGLPADLEISGDRHLIQRVFKNLIENAVKFNTKPEKKVLLEAETNADVVQVTVTDEGGGIPPEDLERITGKFYQSEPTFTGSIDGWGLGLAFSKLVVERHGGRFEIESRLSKGTAVKLTLPKA